MKLYSTVRGAAQAEQIIDKSRFIAYVSPAESKEEADAFIASIKKKHKDATHNVPAMVIGEKFQIQWASDDGEPQGTSGAPMVQMLVNEGITNVVVVVTRYFGGIKLGTGGLVRAYTSSAKLGLEAAGICDIEEMCLLTYSLDYTYLAKLQNLAGGELFKIQDIVYTDVVEVILSCYPDKEEEVISILTNLTGGKGTLKNQCIELVRN
ncbi:MAG: YigZ family protein [Firmicutes bacterium]|nr:YigZ family protein [Bacillota bacterium]